MFVCIPGSVFKVMALVPCLVVTCNVVKKAVWLSVTWGTSLGSVKVMLLVELHLLLWGK